MNRALCALLLTMLLLPVLDGAAAKERPRKPAKETKVERQSPEAKRVTAVVKAERKQTGGPPADTPAQGKQPVKIGPPVEREMKKAKGKVFDLRALPSTPPRQRERPERHGPPPNPVMIEPPAGTSSPSIGEEGFRLPAIEAAAPAPISTFDGLDRENWGAGSPPDTTGDVGPTHYIQGVNTSVGVYRKSDGFRLAAFTFDTLMSQGNFGNLCDTDNFGDPVVLYDTFEDRWILTDFAFQLDGQGNINPPVAYQCFAVSMSGDPVSGGWNFYSIEVTDGLHDYEKLGVWSDGIYMSANMFGFSASGTFQGVRAWALNKAQMYAGSPTVQIVQFDIGSGDFTVVPSNARLQTGTPPPGRPNLFTSTWNYLNAVSVYKFAVNWTSIGLSTLTGPDVPLAGTSWPDAGPANVPQSGTAQLLDALPLRAMVQNQYTNLGGTESLWIPHTVRRANNTGFAAPRWYEVNVTGGTVAASIPQAATWDPDAANVTHRFMPSLAVDRARNMALAYSTSSGTTFPSIKYAGRLATDPVNTFSQTEQTLFAGTASQTSSERWGDYSSVMLDPDGCTFWITNQYANPAAQTFDKRWKTRIGSFRYSQCTMVGAGGALSGTVTATAGGAPINGATVALGARSTTTNAAGAYAFTAIPAGTYPSMTVSLPGYTSATATNIPITDGGTTTRDFSLGTASSNACLTDTSQADFQAGVGTDVSFTVTPGSVTLGSVDATDQITTNYTTSGIGFSGTSFAGQTFTPGVTGALKRIDVEIFCASCSGTNPNLTVEARTTSGGNIVMTAGGLLASATIAGTSSGSGGFLTFNFVTPPTLTAGTQYGFVVRSVTTRTTGTQAVLVSDGDGLTGGRRQTCSSASCSNSTGQSNDIVFISYMNVGFASSGTFVSSTKDGNPAFGMTPAWSTITWNGVIPANTTLQIQMAGSNSAAGPFNFVGPDGTGATYFASGASIAQFNSFRYLQYKAYFTTSNAAVTATLNDVALCYQSVACPGSAPTITPTPAQVCASSTGNTASGPAGMTAYAWSITNGTITAGATAQTVMYTAGTTATVTLMLVVTEPGGCQKATVLNVPVFGVTPTINAGGPTTFCAGGSVLLTSSSASGNQWYLNGNPLNGETNQTYTATASGNYTVVVTDNGCTSAPSSATTVTVNAIPATPTITPGGPTTFCAGGSVLLTSSSASGNQWFLNGNPIGAATNQTYSATASGNYTVVVTTNGCASAASSATNVTVNPIPATPTITPGGPTTFCAGGSVLLTSSSASGNQWFLNGNPIGAATNQTYSVSASGNYTVVVTTNGCASAASSATSVTVNPIPATPTITPGGPTTFCTGGSVLLSSSSASGNQWYLDGNPIGAATNQTYSASAAGNYTVIVTTNGCASAASSATAVTVNPIPATPTINAGGPTTFCAGGSVLLTSSSASGNQWFLNGNPIGAATNQTYSASASGNYTVVVTTNGCASAASSATSVTVNPTPATPTITPDGPTTFCTGGSVLLTSSSASGNQWYLNGNPIGAATNQTYSASASGNYTVIVTTNGCASSASAPTTVTVNPIPATPTINAGGPTTFCAGGSVLLTSSSASGNQWYLDGNPIGGATNQSFSAGASGNYTVVVTTNGCSSAASSATSVTVNPTPAIPTITPDGPTTFCAGGSVLLTSSSASGNQWYLDGNPIGAATNQTYTATAAGNYTVVVTTNGCASTASAATTVTVNPIPATPTINAGGPTTFCVGGSVSLTSSSASGNQWYLNGNPIGAATNQTYSASASGNYTVVVTTNGCASAASSATSVTVNPTPATPTITPDGPTTFCAGGSVLLTSSSASGNQWYLDGNPIGAATNQTYTATAAGNYTVVVTTNGCASAPSAATAVTVNPIPATPTVNAGGPTTFCAGGSVLLTSSSASGNQWYLSGNPINGATNQTFDAGASGNYTVVVTTNNCASAASSATAVTVNPTPATPTITPDGPTTFCTGGSVLLTSSSASGNQWYLNGNPIGGETNQTYSASASGNYTVVVTTDGCASAASSATTVTVNPSPATPTITPDGPTTFCTGGSVLLTSSSASGNQWYLGGNPIGGETNQTYSASASGNYTVIVTTNGCASATSSATTVTVNPIPATPSINAGGPTTFCAGGSVLLTSSSASGNQWYLNGNPIGGATNQTFDAGASGNYTVIVTTNGCASAASSTTTVTVNPTPATPTITPDGPTTFCTGGSVLLTSSSASGNQWYLNGNPIGGETNQTYSASASGNYTVIVTTNGCASAASSATTVTVNPIPATPTITPDGPTTFCAGGSVLLTSSSASGNQWYLNGNPIGVETNQTYSATASGNYTVVVTTNGCASAASTAITVTVNPTPATPTIEADGPTTFCTGGSVLLTSSSASGNQWYLNGNPIGGETNQTYNATASGNYTVVVTTNGCASAASSATTVTVNPIPATPTITPDGPTTFCAGGSVLLTSSSASGNQWYLNGNPIGAATNQTYSANVSGNYTVVVTTNGCASAASSATAVTVNPTPAAPTIEADGPTTFCTGGSVLLTSSSASGNQWYLDGTPLNGETSQTYNATAAGNYTAIVTTNGCTSPASAATTVTVNPIPATPTINAGGPTTFCTGGSVLLTSTSASGNQWYLNGTPLNGETNQTYNATASGNYTVVVTANSCASAASAATTVTVNPIPATPTINAGGPTTFCAGGSVLLTSSSASGNQWYLNGNPIGGETNQTYNATAAGNYTVVVTTDGCTSAASATTAVTVNPVPATPTITGASSFCAGSSTLLTSSSATGNHWFLNGNPIGSATDQTYNATAAGNYTVVVTTSGCASAPSAAKTVTVTPLPATPTISAGGATTFCAGGSVLLTSSSTTGNQWFLNGNPIGGATSRTFSAGASGSYTVVVTTNGCSSAHSAATTVTVKPMPSAPAINAGGPTTFCEGGSVTLNSSTATGNQWYRDYILLAGQTGQSILVTTAGSYSVTTTLDGCTSAASTPTYVTVNPRPDATITVASPMFSGASANATVAESCLGATFAWTITGGTITSGNGTRSITFTAGSAGTLVLGVTVTNAFGCVDSKTANVSVQLASFGAPPVLKATATGTTTTNLIWAAVASAANYEVYRATDGVNFTPRGTTAATTFGDSGLTPSTTYFYQVRAIKADNTPSAFSAIDPATTVVFTDDPYTATCPPTIRAVHVSELRSAINILRASVGLSAFAFTDPTIVPAVTTIKAVHVAEMRTALNAALAVIGVTPVYTHPTLTPPSTTVRGIDMQELRDLTR